MPPWILICLSGLLATVASQPTFDAFLSRDAVADGVIGPGEYNGTVFLFNFVEVDPLIPLNPGVFAAPFLSNNRTSAPVEDLSVRMQTTFNRTHLFFGFEVTDQIIDNSSTDAAYNNDGIELLISDIIRSGAGGGYEGFQLVCSCIGQKNTISATFGSGSWTCGASVTATGYILEFAIPFSLMDTVDGAGSYKALSSGLSIAFDVNVNDNDAPNTLRGAQTSMGRLWAPNAPTSRLPGYRAGDGEWVVPLTMGEVDECAEAMHNCHVGARCFDAVPSFVCACNVGWSGNGVDCTDLNECVLETDTCSPTDAVCTNAPGSFTCACNRGYAGNGSFCEPADECFLGLDNCNAQATCTDISLSFECVCNLGWTGNGTDCVDVQECLTATCGANASCVELPGSFACECDTGFSGDGFDCADFDECALGLHNCNANATCSNAMGSFACGCNPGYSGSGVDCVDIDECASVALHNCDANADCTNNNGSFACGCRAGWSGSGISADCANINECGLALHNCDGNATCADNPGSFACTCSTGYTGSGLSCANVVECTTGNLDDCDAEATCADVAGSFLCSCNLGWTGSGVVCDDVDECTTANLDNCNAQAACTNTDGSFTCACNAGWTGDGLACADVDECTTGSLHNCHSNAACADQDGSFTCACNFGYQGNGTHCENIDECATMANNCDSDASCSDTDGAFTCTCLPGFTGSGVVCDDMDECSLGTHGCQAKSECINTVGSRNCVCFRGLVEDSNGDCILDELTPLFTRDTYTLTVYEHRAVSYVITTLTVGNADPGQYAVSIVASTQPGVYSLDASTGDLRVAQALDFEAPGVVLQTVLTVRVVRTSAPGLGLESNATVELTLLDSNDHAPILPTNETTFYASVAEDVAPGASLPLALRSSAALDLSGTTDEDEGANAVVSFLVTSPANAPFAFTAGGVLQVSGSLDREATPRFVLQCQARSTGVPGNLDTPFTVVVLVTDVNDQAPARGGNAPTTIEVRETTGIGTVIGRLTGTDRDTSPALAYRITGGDAADFCLDPASGDLLLLSAVSVGQSYDVSYEITDGAQLLDGGSVTINAVSDERCASLPSSCLSNDPCREDGTCFVAANGQPACVPGTFAPPAGNTGCVECACEPADSNLTGVSWPRAACGQTAEEPCSSLEAGRYGGRIRRQCLAGGLWAAEDFSECVTLALLTCGGLDMGNADAGTLADFEQLLQPAAFLGDRDIAVVKQTLKGYGDAIAQGGHAASTLLLPSLLRSLNRLLDLPSARLTGPSTTGRVPLGYTTAQADFTFTPWPATAAAPNRIEMALILSIFSELLPNLVDPAITLSTITTAPSSTARVLLLRLVGKVSEANFAGVVAATNSLLTGPFLVRAALVLPDLFGLGGMTMALSGSMRLQTLSLATTLDDVVASVIVSMPLGQSLSVSTDSVTLEVRHQTCAEWDGYVWFGITVPASSVPACGVEGVSAVAAAWSYSDKASAALFPTADGQTLLSNVVSFTYGSPASSSSGPLAILTFELLGALNGATPACAYWDLDASRFETEGCTVQSQTPTTVTCACTHLTHFAVVSAPSSGPSSSPESTNLTANVFWLLIFCVPCLLVVALHYMLVQRLWTYGRFLLVNFALAMASALLLFVIGMDQTESRACSAVALAVHFALLSAGLWLLCHCALILIKVRSVAQGLVVETPRAHVISIGVSILLPFCYVGICATLAFEQYGTALACWLDSKDLLWTLVAAGGALLALSMGCCLMSWWRLAFGPVLISVDPKALERRARISGTLKATLLFVPFAYATWIVGIVSVEHLESVALQYIFAGLAMATGIFFLLFFYAADERVWGRRRLFKHAKGGSILPLVKTLDSQDQPLMMQPPPTPPLPPAPAPAPAAKEERPPNPPKGGNGKNFDTISHEGLQGWWAQGTVRGDLLVPPPPPPAAASSATSDAPPAAAVYAVPLARTNNWVNTEAEAVEPENLPWSAETAQELNTWDPNSITNMRKALSQMDSPWGNTSTTVASPPAAATPLPGRLQPSKLAAPRNESAPPPPLPERTTDFLQRARQALDLQQPELPQVLAPLKHRHDVMEGIGSTLGEMREETHAEGWGKVKAKVRSGTLADES